MLEFKQNQENDFQNISQQEGLKQSSADLYVSEPTNTSSGRKWPIVLGVLIILLGGLLLAVYRFNLLTVFFPKDVFAQALQKIGQMETYRQIMEIQVNGSGQKLTIKGTTEIDVISNKAKSHFTTLAPGLEFDTDSITDGKNIFIRMDLKDSPLASLLALPDSWIRFDVSDLPQEYKELVAGQDYKDVLALLKFGSQYITKISEEKQTLNGHAVVYYKIAFSPDLKNVVSGESLKNLVDSITKNGSVEIWVNKKTSFIEKLIVQAESIKIISEMSDINEPVAINPPQSFVTLDEWKQEIFLASLPKNKVSEVFIAGYGGVPDATIKSIQQIIENTIGVKTTISGNFKKLPVLSGIYDEARNQYDGDIVWGYFSKIFQKNNDFRYIIVVNEDIYTKIQPERAYILSRALPRVNTAIISVNRLAHKSDSSTEKVQVEIYNQRIQKLALRILGVTVGFISSPDANDINCVMYQALTLDELDRIGLNYCDITKKAIGKIFVPKSQ